MLTSEVPASAKKAYREGGCIFVTISTLLDFEIYAVQLVTKTSLSTYTKHVDSFRRG
jgi:hypothetical protein